MKGCSSCPKSPDCDSGERGLDEESVVSCVPALLSGGQGFCNRQVGWR